MIVLKIRFKIELSMKRSLNNQFKLKYLPKDSSKSFKKRFYYYNQLAQRYSNKYQ